MSRVYLDYSSSTPLLPEVKSAIVQAVEEFGNPSSLHEAGRRARQALERARGQVAALIGAKPEEVYFTSCGTESNNWAIRGLLAANKRRGNHLIVSSIEHPSILLLAKRFEREGADVTYLPVTSEGLVEPQALRDALTPTTVLVSIMHANGEIGTIEPIAELAKIAKAGGAFFHTDAVASAGHASVDVKQLGVDALSIAANQFYGPSGAAALYLREGVRVLPLLEGGGQETGARSGTENLIGIVGMGAAAELARTQMASRAAQTSRLRDRLKEGILQRLEGVRLNGSWHARVPHNLHLCIEGVSSESLVLGLDAQGIAVGIGSACNSKAMRPSHVLKAMGLSDDEARGALLLTVGVPTTEQEIDRCLEVFTKVAAQLRNVTALTLAK